VKSPHGAFHTTAVSILVFLLAACTYHGAAKPVIYSSQDGPAPAVQKKLAVKVAVVKNKTLQTRPLRVRGGGHGVEINYYDALTSAVETSFSGIFMTLRLIDDPTMAESEELVAEYNMQYRELSRNEGSGDFRFGTLFTARLKDSTSGLVLAEVEHADEVQYSRPASVTAAAIVTGASLFLLSPITIPLTTMAIGHEAEKLVEDSIKASVNVASEKLITDPRLIAVVRMRGSSGTTVSAPRGSDAPQAVGAPPSKYSDFLNAVVIVRSSRGVGSGFFVSKRGHLITNRHVVGGDATVSVKLRSGSVLIGTVIASDIDSDLALLSVS
jgi:hypothetical protein